MEENTSIATLSPSPKKSPLFWVICIVGLVILAGLLWYVMGSNKTTLQQSNFPTISSETQPSPTPVPNTYPTSN